jgi:hypothetical protein
VYDGFFSRLHEPSVKIRALISLRFWAIYVKRLTFMLLGVLVPGWYCIV